MRNRLPLPAALAAIAAAGLLHWLAPGAASARPETEKQAGAATDTKATAPAATKDLLILKSGKTVEGRILEETATTIRFEVRMGNIKAPTTYDRSEILEIKRGIADEAAPASATEEKSKVAANSTTPAAAPKKKDKDDEESRRTPTGDENAKKVYLVELKGRWGMDVSETPLKRVMDDVEKVNPDVVVLKINSESAPGGRDQFDALFRTEDIAPVIERQIVEKNRRIVFWVEVAQGGAAFLPFISQEIYFTSEGWLGGIGNLGSFNIGDHMVNEKQISLRLGHAEGMFIKGGYAPELVRAMARSDYWLYVRFEGGKPIYSMDPKTPEEIASEGWILLSDDGKGPNEDKYKSLPTSNDTLRLNASMAQRLGVADGVADTMDQLADKLGIGTNYVVLDNARGSKIMKQWRDEMADAVGNISQNPDRPGKLLVQLGETPETGPTPEETRKNLAKRMQIYRQIRSILTNYEEVFDREGQGRAQIDVSIEELKQKIAAVTKAIQEAEQQKRGR